MAPVYIGTGNKLHVTVRDGQVLPIIYLVLIQIDPEERKKRRQDFEQVSAQIETKKLKLDQARHSLDEEKSVTEVTRNLFQSTKGILSSHLSELARLRQRRRRDLRELEARKRELRLLQQLVKEHEETNEELKETIEEKEKEIRQLHESIQKLDDEIQSAQQEIQTLRGKLQEITSQLEVKSAKVKELEKSTNMLEISLDHERRRVDLMLLSAMSGKMRAVSAETKVSTLLI